MKGFLKRMQHIASEVMSLMTSLSSTWKELLEEEWKAEQKISVCLCGNPGFAPIQHPDGSIFPSGGMWSKLGGGERERRHKYDILWEIWGLLRLEKPKGTTMVEEYWQLIRTREWAGNRWNRGLTPAEKRLLALHRIKLPQSTGEAERINSQKTRVGAFPGKDRPAKVC